MFRYMFFKKEKVKIRKTEEVAFLVCYVYNPRCGGGDNKFHRKLTEKQSDKSSHVKPQ